MGNALLHLGQLKVFLSEFFGVLGGWSYLKMAILYDFWPNNMKIVDNTDYHTLEQNG